MWQIRKVAKNPSAHNLHRKSRRSDDAGGSRGGDDEASAVRAVLEAEREIFEDRIVVVEIQEDLVRLRKDFVAAAGVDGGGLHERANRKNNANRARQMLLADALLELLYAIF